MRYRFTRPTEAVQSLRRRASGVTIGLVTLGGAAGLGGMTASNGQMPAAIALALLGLTASLISAGIVLALTFPAVFFTYRVGPGGLNMSVADLMLLCAIPVSVLVTSGRLKSQARLLKLILVYEVVLLSVVAVHPTSIAIAEWVHRLALMAGGILVGAAVVRLGVVRLALRLFLATAAVYALAAVIQCVRYGFAPAYPLGIHKNAAGSLFGMAIVMMATLPLRNIVSRHAYLPLYVLYGLGLAATQSRGPMVGVGVVVGFLFFARRGAGRFRVITAIGGIVLLIFVVSSVTKEAKNDPYKLQSLGVRQRQHAQASAVFRDHPIAGRGIRYYRDPTQAPYGQPSSILYEVTAESGIIGAADLLMLVVGTLMILRRLNSPYGPTALAVFGVKVVHALFDNFWVAGPFTFPWLLIGVALALEVSASRSSGEAEPHALELAVAGS